MSRSDGPIIIAPPRFSVVPWLSTEIDLRPMGEPEILVQREEQIVHGLHIPHPFGRDTDRVLWIRSTRGDGNDGGEIVLSYDECGAAPLSIPRPVNLALHSNPRRMEDEGDD